MSTLGEIARAAVQRADAWVNTVTGIGDPALDRAASGNWAFRSRGRISDETLASAYEEDDVVAAVASAAPDSELGRGYEIVSPREGRLVELEEAFEAVGWPTAGDVFRSARTWEELFGGGAILVGAQDGRPPEEPLDPYAVRRVDFLLDLDPRECRADATSYARGGAPSHYWVQVGGFSRRVHASRLVIFPGLSLPRRERRTNQGWGASRVRRAWSAIEDFHAAWAGARHQLTDASQPVWRIHGLWKMVAGGESSLIRQRVREAEYLRSMTRALILDQDHEAWERQASSLQGLAPVLDQNFLRLSMAVKIPVEVLLGRAPAGLNSSGSFPLQLWYGRLESDRELHLRPRMERVIDLVARSWEGPYGGRPPQGWQLHLLPLGQLSEREDAEVDEIRVRSLGDAVERLDLPRDAARERAAEVLGVEVRAAAGAGPGPGPSPAPETAAPDPPPAAEPTANEPERQATPREVEP